MPGIAGPRGGEKHAARWVSSLISGGGRFSGPPLTVFGEGRDCLQ